MLLTRAPLESTNINTGIFSFDLHVLNTPPAFVLSQNQTLRKNSEKDDSASLLKRLLFISQIDFGDHSGVAPFMSPRPRVSSDDLAAFHESTRSAQFNLSSLPDTQRYIMLCGRRLLNLFSGPHLAAGTSCVRPCCQRTKFFE